MSEIQRGRALWRVWRGCKFLEGAGLACYRRPIARPWPAMICILSFGRPERDERVDGQARDGKPDRQADRGRWCNSSRSADEGIRANGAGPAGRDHGPGSACEPGCPRQHPRSRDRPRGAELPQQARYHGRRNAVFVKAGEGLAIERRGTRNGHQYHLLGHTNDRGSRVVVEPYMITLTEESDVFPLFQHAGLEFLYMLEGEVVYRHADKLYTMLPGDSLFFDADAPHGPEELRRLPIRFLSIISYPREEE